MFGSYVTESFSITKSFGIGKANFGFWDAEDGQDDGFFFEEPVITELVLQTKVGPGFSSMYFMWSGLMTFLYFPSMMVVNFVKCTFASVMKSRWKLSSVYTHFSHSLYFDLILNAWLGNCLIIRQL